MACGKVQVFGRVGAVNRNGMGLTVLIPTAGSGRRMKSYGPKALIELRHETVIGRQLSILKEFFPAADFVVVLGFEADKVYRALPSWVRVVESELHEETNVARSIDIGLRACGSTEKVLLVYGDLVFSANSFAGLPLNQSSIFVDPKGIQMGADEVGLNVVDGRVTRLDYGLEDKWAQIALCAGQELELLRRIASERDRRRCFGFELLNAVIDKGGSFRALAPEGMRLAEIDSSKDIERAMVIASG